jgi:hypothetical protein
MKNEHLEGRNLDALGPQTDEAASLAMAELYITLATVFSRFDFELYQTDETDVQMAHAYLVPYPKWESKGVRARVRQLA